LHVICYSKWLNFFKKKLNLRNKKKTLKNKIGKRVLIKKENSENGKQKNRRTNMLLLVRY